MTKIASAGTLPNVPSAPGVYVLVCGHMGETDCHLGEVLYIGVSNNLRRRVAYALAAVGKSAPHGAQGPLEEFQGQGGIAHLFYHLTARAVDERLLEKALLIEYARRRGRSPRWNRAKLGRVPPDAGALRLANHILDRLNVQRLPA